MFAENDFSFHSLFAFRGFMKTMVFCRLAKASVIEMKAQINSGLLSLNTVDILGQIVFYYEGLS